ncbi:MAG: hypothetical protein HY841_06780 [Bacteroidetes bacterium]|nr:hypothetical protein [Bacteroidota bacterium]
MKKIFFISVLLSSGSWFFSSCHCKKKTTTDTVTSIEQKRDFEKEGYTKATVIYYEVSGCEYILKLEDEKKLEPTNLSLGFKKDLLSVWIKYIPKKNAVSTCMAGQIVELTDIQGR